MAGVSFGDLPESGRGVTANPDEAVKFAEQWFGDVSSDELVGLFMLPNRSATAMSLVDLRTALEKSGMDDLIWPEDSVPQNVYHNAALLSGRPGKGRRGAKGLIGRSPGFWCDLDVKPDAFDTWESVRLAYADLDDMGIGPQIVVTTGSGGAHLYWRVDGGLAGEDIDHWGRRIRLLVEERTGRAVDHCENRDRVLRTPGSIRWPKKEEGPDARPAPVEMLRGKPGFVDLERVGILTGPLWASSEAAERAARRELKRREDEAAALSVKDYAASDWRGLWSRTHWQEDFAAGTTWDAILEAAGWTRTGGPDYSGRVSWRRPLAPGEDPATVNPRSALVDWDESPQVMSLVSGSPETGLLDLREAGIALTKARVAARLLFDDDMAALARAWMGRSGE